MFTVLRAKSQITIPSLIVAGMGLKEGNQLDISEADGVIRMIPVVVRPKAYVNELQNEISMLKESITAEKQPVFDNIDALFDRLEAD